MSVRLLHLPLATSHYSVERGLVSAVRSPERNSRSDPSRSTVTSARGGQCRSQKGLLISQELAPFVPFVEGVTTAFCRVTVALCSRGLFAD